MFLMLKENTYLKVQAQGKENDTQQPVTFNPDIQAGAKAGLRKMTPSDPEP